MSTDPVVIPRRELERALQITTSNTFSYAAIVASTALAACLMLSVTGFTPMAAAILILGVSGTLAGVIKLWGSLRASAAIQAKLRAQELPAARLLGS